ncbi:hypothetical protein G6L12_11695 [Agrobacterium rhizogenes]|nr:hypothetical protein [Rhizobium rhizogenes]NTF75132.1 hypothetical protein [Rhizobium rhizogenes]NTH51526.1 hypothetical protein [Rhizobium rhizogenes]NTH71110.1 hypothetical protein [Rhizobium rhizogenes]
MSTAELKTGPRPLVVSAKWAAEHHHWLAYRRISYFVDNGAIILDHVASLIALLLGIHHAGDEEAIESLAIRVIAGWISQPEIRDRLSASKMVAGMFDTLVNLEICTEDRRAEFYQGIVDAKASRTRSHG